MKFFSVSKQLPFLVALTLVLCQYGASAQAQPSGLPLWEVGGFAGSLTSPAYPASTERLNRNLVLPYFIYRGERFSVDRDGIDARLRLAPNYELDLGVSGSFPAMSDGISVRQGMPDMGTLLEFGPRLKVKLPSPGPGMRLGLDLPLREVFEVSGGTRGQGLVFEPAMALDMANVGGGWSLTAKFGLTWGDQQINQYFYGVAPAYATALRPAFEAQSGLMSARASLSASKSLNPDVRLFGYARMDYFGLSANTASPLHLQNSSPSMGLGLTWTLGRSEARVGE
jgi:outer membrane scaffolding protein for murein synthesis (MipA/OmpV family)